jgi:hypothetical protein
MNIYYKGGYKYRLVKYFRIDIPIRPAKPVDTDFIKLSLDGRLEIMEGYNWDGPSGPTIDTITFMRGSLIHDALYQLMREGHLEGGNSPTRKAIDKLLVQHCIEDGMTRIRAWWVYKGVHYGASKSSTARNIRQVRTAPKETEK